MSEWEKTGVLSLNDISGSIPSRERFKAGPVAIIECIQHIPCNPCVDACPFDAISINGGMTETPKVDFQLCTGCGTCVSICPGLAIFIVDLTYSDKKATILLPYELSPLPNSGDKVKGLDRGGNCLADVEVLKATKKNGSGLVSIAVDKELAMEIRNIEV